MYFRRNRVLKISTAGKNHELIHTLVSDTWEIYKNACDKDRGKY